MWQDATEMAEAVRQKQISALELVNDAIERIESLNPSLNAVVYQQYEEAQKRACSASFETEPFAGVPLLLKDLGQEQEGTISSSGSKLFANYQSKQTDYYVTALEKLGFIILGRTNTPEFGFKNISDSRLHGSVNLPRDVKRNAGGSSGGAAAAVASGMVPLACASDGGGSIRIPASFNGLIGLKPTRGRIPVGPSSYRGWQGASVSFALTKTVRDTRNLLFHFQREQLESPFPLPLLSQKDLFQYQKRPLRIAYSNQSPIGQPISQAAQAALDKALNSLIASGHEVVEVSPVIDGIEAHLGRAMQLEDMELMSWALYQAGQKIPAKLYSAVLQKWDQYSAKMAQFHKEYDLLLTPTTADVAPLHDVFQLSDSQQHALREIEHVSMKEQQNLIWQMFEKSLAATPFTQQANLTGQPAISLPVYEQDGLPLGVQFTAAKGREDLLLAIAEEFEQNGQLM